MVVAREGLYEDLASKLSMTTLKQGEALRRLGECLVTWFGADR